MVLAVAQALGGANNIIIYSTASIVGAVLAPDKGLATLPITCMVIGMWLGTLPVGALARRFGRRFALQIGSAFGIAVRADLLRGGDDTAISGCCCSAPSAAGSMPPRMQSYRFAAADTASECLPAQGGVLGAGRRRVRRR